MDFSFLPLVGVAIFFECVPFKAAIAQNFQLVIRNWSFGTSRHKIKVFKLKA